MTQRSESTDAEERESAKATKKAQKERLKIARNTEKLIKSEQRRSEKAQKRAEKRARREKEKNKSNASSTSFSASSSATVDKVRRPIGRTLMLIITLLIVVSLGGVTAVVSYFVTRDIKINALENNLAINERTAQSSELSIRTAVAATDFFLDIALSRTKDTDDSETADDEHFSSAEQKFFEWNEDILAIYARDSLFVNKSLQQSREITPNVLDKGLWNLLIVS